MPNGRYLAGFALFAALLAMATAIFHPVLPFANPTFPPPASRPAAAPTQAPVAISLISTPHAVPTPTVAVTATTAAASPTLAAKPAASPTAAPTPSSSDSDNRGAPVARPTVVRVPVHLQDAYEWAATEFGVPVEVLLAVSYHESLWEQHNGQPSTTGGYGVMHLTDVAGTDDPNEHTVQTAVKLLNALPDSPFHVTADQVKTDPYQNIRGGAALLAQYELKTVGKGARDNPADWYGAVVLYSGSSDLNAGTDFANRVFATINAGATRTTTSGDKVTLTARAVKPNLTAINPLTVANTKTDFTPDCPPDLKCTTVPALYQLRNSDDLTDIGNYQIANRPADGLQINYIVIHDTEASFNDSIKIFQEPIDQTTAHYLIRSSDGKVVQIVPNQDIAYHARNWFFNSHAIGIEHEGFAVQGATWYSETLYETSAELVRYLAREYNIPLDRAHIVGHDNIPGESAASEVSMHWDPGPFWDWNHYMDLLGAPIKPGNNPNILQINPNFQKNVQTLAASCTKSGCKNLPAQPTNFVWVHQAPSLDSPLVQDPATINDSNNSPTPNQGTRLPEDWGDQAATGEQFYKIGQQGDWVQVWFGGQKGWIYNPNGQNAQPGSGVVVRTRTDEGDLIPVYGGAYPEIQAFPTNVIPPGMSSLGYIQGGQTYVTTGLVSSDYYSATYNARSAADNPVVKGTEKYYQIYYNHRVAFLKAEDVVVVKGS
ncbi:MAG TPA: N-acetylmuramoyl-L-alanine amidase [Chloroflexota bacterium]|nr:N-acetylmuramoyl-L-alanine amidase [Chloroflexota bacterium]